MRKKLGLLETGKPPKAMAQELPSFVHAFQNLFGDQFTYATWHVEGGVFPDSVWDADAWLVTGSPHGAYEDHAWIPPLEQFIRDCFNEKIPMVGICFGHQVIAQALGGQVEKFKGGWVVGAQDYTIDGAAKPTRLNAWHQDQVVTCPPDARVVASSSACKYAALAYEDVILTYQPHPEFDQAAMEGLIAHRTEGIVPSDLVNTARETLHAPNDSQTIGAQLAAFLSRSSA